MLKRKWLVCMAACALAATPPIASAAPDGYHSLTDLRAEDIANPTQPGPSEEAALVELTKWAIDNGALAQTFDPDSRINWLLFPEGSAVGEVPDYAESPTDVRITKARFAKETYDAAEDAVTELAVSEKGAPYSFSLRIDAKEGVLSVETDAPAEITAPLSERFGEVIVFVPTAAGTFLNGTRPADFSPHWGGANLRIGSTPWCTAGPSVRVGSTSYGTTAGHCGANGTVWNSGGFSFGWTHVNGFNWGGSGYDTARITGGGNTYSARIYHGGVSTGTTLLQVGAGDPAGAITVWTSGSFGGSTSGVVTDLNTVFCSGATCAHGCFSTDNTNVVNGDSGAVVHTVSGSNAGVRGTLTGENPSRSHVTKWSTIAAVLGVQIVT